MRIVRDKVDSKEFYAFNPAFDKEYKNKMKKGLIHQVMVNQPVL